MPQLSAGLLVYRRRRGALEVLLVHPGGPYFRNKDAGSWSVPKGLVEEGEPTLEAARRELEEETGLTAPEGEYLDLGEVRQKGGKVVHAWGVEGELDPEAIRSNSFEIEWPPRSGRRQSFPEVDRAAFFSLEEATTKILEAQRPFLGRLEGLAG